MRRLHLLWLLVAAVAVGSHVTGLTAAVLTDPAPVPANTFQTAASLRIEFVKAVGTATCGAGLSTVTVPAGGVAAGNTLIVRVVLRSPGLGPVSVLDTKGNTYVQDANALNGTAMRTVVLSARITTALAAGDTITVSHPSNNSSSVAVEEFSGVAASSRVDTFATTAGNSATPSATVTTTNARDLIYGVVGIINNLTFTEPGGGAWSAVTHLPASCGGAPGNSTNHAAYRIVSATGSYTYNPTVSNSGQWAEALVAYKAA